MSYPYTPIDNWQAFEVFCRDFFETYWKTLAINVVGRAGQSQDGIDILAMLPEMNFRGVQCKQKLTGQLKRAEMKAELEATVGLKGARLELYVFATTAPRDKNVQQWARELGETVDFEVSVFAWHDFCDALADVAFQDVVAKHFPRQVFVRSEDPASPEEALAVFRSEHFSGLLPLPGLAQARGQRDADLLLTDLYTALDVEATLGATVEDGAAKGAVSLPGDATYLAALTSYAESRVDLDKDDSRFVRRCRALEAAAANPRLVLIGAPGSGKSTFGRFLVASLLGETLKRPETNLDRLNGNDDFVAWRGGAPLAFFVSLQKFQASEWFPSERQAGRARHLVAYLESLSPDGALFAKGLARALRDPDGALMVLDGLDETPSAEASRVRLCAVIRDFARAYPGCRVLVTSRPYAYKSDSPWRLDKAGFASVELAPFDRGQQRALIEVWYRRLVLDVPDERRRAMIEDLSDKAIRNPYLAPLASSPLMLTMMADLHARNGGRLPTGGRAELYKESVELLLDRWNETKEGRKPTEVLGMPLEHIREVLEKLAFDVHRSRGANDDETPEIEHTELWAALAETRSAYGHEGLVDDTQIMRYLHQRSGILIGESEKIYRFPHRSYQEYLAAAHLTQNDFPALLNEAITEDPVLWREVVPLAVGQVPDFMAWTILETLVGTEPVDPPLDDPYFFRALLAGLSLRERNLTAKRLSPANETKKEQIRLWLRKAVELGALDVRDRAQAGQVLGLLGDDRPGVGLGEDGLPSFEWVEIPAGTFVMGSERSGREKPVHDEAVDGFRISRYPLTHAQYQPFVEDGGYSDRWKHCWTEAGWEWKQNGGIDQPLVRSSPFDLPNHPRVSGSWYEAVAYCRWLSEVTGTIHRLPTEAEWERAARGVDGRAYPWGEKFDETRCNTDETRIGTTTAVGLFPQGESPAGSNDLGVLDASGNVLEWCSAKDRDSYEEPADDDLEGSAVRVLRGGSFAHDSIHARCAYRSWFAPVNFSFNLGFRVVSPMIL